MALPPPENAPENAPEDAAENAAENAADDARDDAPDDAHEVGSPCISLCVMDAGLGYCIGCFRTLDEIAGWIDLDSGARLAVWDAIVERRKSAGPCDPHHPHDPHDPHDGATSSSDGRGRA